ncbi:RHS repeat-associated core domain-containing protein [Pseudomonas sp. NPDC089422]|uniref:RHS repeat-associated core domain-containing protein n=1 Tax=Pseudomonas sp. NPDC089422 TaxID=3364466 RepID=UPI003826BBE7
MRKIFYLRNRVASVLEAGVWESYVCAADQAVAIDSKKKKAAIMLLVNDQAFTVLAGVKASCLQHQRFNVYGFSIDLMVAIGLNGQPVDRLTRRYQLGHGHREYDPAIMRFASADGLSPFGKGGINAYAYCENDPVNKSDPSGQWGQRRSLPENSIFRTTRRRHSAFSPMGGSSSANPVDARGPMSRFIAGSELDELLAKPFNQPYYETQAPVSTWGGLLDDGYIDRAQFNALMSIRRYAIEEASFSNRGGYPIPDNWRVGVQAVTESDTFKVKFSSIMSELYTPTDNEFDAFARRASHYVNKAPIFGAATRASSLRFS